MDEYQIFSANRISDICRNYKFFCRKTFTIVKNASIVGFKEENESEFARNCHLEKTQSCGDDCQLDRSLFVRDHGKSGLYFMVVKR